MQSIESNCNKQKKHGTADNQPQSNVTERQMSPVRTLGHLGTDNESWLQ